MNSYKIMIDAGHGGKDNGASNTVATEKVLNLKVANYLKEMLEFNDFTVGMTRTSDVFVELSQRSAMANNFNANFMVAIHHNAGRGIGYEVIHSIIGGEGLKLAQEICGQFKNISQVQHRGAYSRQGKNGDYYAVIRASKMPTVITEFAFMDSDDFHNINSDDKLKNEAIAIGKAICNVLGITPRETVLKGQLYRVRIALNDAKSQIGAYTVLQNAIDKCNKVNGYKVFNEAGEVVYQKVVTPAPAPIPVSVPQPVQPVAKPKYDFATLQNLVGTTPDNIAGAKTLEACAKFILKKKLINPKNEIVRWIQNRLNYLGYNCGTADGIFGKNTDTAVKKFQSANGLTADSIVGFNTWKKLLGL